MSRRIEIELTSDRGDGTWTWRAAGARQPRGVVEGTILPSDAKTGDVLRAEVDVDLDGVTVLSVATGPARQRSEPERIEPVGRASDDEQMVTTQLLGKREGRGRGGFDRPLRGEARRDAPRPKPRSERPSDDRRPRGDRPDRPPRGDRPDRGRSGARADGRGEGRPDDATRGERRPRPDRPRRPAPPPLPERPKPKRLRAGRAHRKAVLAELSPEQQPIAEQVLKGGMASVRQAIDAENEKRKGEGQPSINATELLGLAEQLLPRLRTAEWRDRAEAALADVEELDLRDLRSVVVASDAAARDDETRAVAAQLREKLEQRVEQEQANWLEDLGLALKAGRVVRALRLSSRPPKAGTMLSPEVRAALVEAANAGLAADVGADRWAAVLDAVAYAPVRGDVKPASVPETPGEDLLAVARKYAGRVPGVAAAFGIEAPAPPARPTGRGMRPPKPARRPGAVPVPRRPPPPPAAPTGVQQTDPTVGQAHTSPPEPTTADDIEATGVQETDPTVGQAHTSPPEPTTADDIEATGVQETDPTVGQAHTSPPEPAEDVAPATEATIEEATTPTPDTGVAEAAVPVEESSALPDQAAEAALEAAPDLDEVSDGEPTA